MDNITLTMTVASVQQLIEDHTTPSTIPYSVELHPLDCEGLKDELNDHGTDPRQNVLGIISNCLLRAAPDVPRGRCRVKTRMVQDLPSNWIGQAVTYFRNAQALNPLAESFQLEIRGAGGSTYPKIDGATLRELSDVELRLWLAGEAALDGVAQ